MILLILFILLLFVNFLLSISEIALSSFGETKIDELKEKKDKSLPYFEKLQKNQEDVFGAIQFAYTFLLITIGIIGYFLISNYVLGFVREINFLKNYSEEISIVVTSLILSIIILIFNILLPKVIAFKYSDFIGKNSVKKLLIVAAALKYLTKGITSFTNLLLIPFKEKVSFSQSKPSEDEILDIISDGVKSGTLDETEQQIIENIFEFTDLRANEVMIPRTEMIAIEINDANEVNLKMIMRTGHTLIPVYEESLDNISGVLHTKDAMKFILENKSIEFKDLIRPAYFVPESKLISQILRDMQKQGERIAIVTDEYGGTEGVITMEDILEEIIGEIKETDSVLSHYSKGKDGKYYVLGSMNISDFNDTFNYSLPESEEYNTVAGFVAEKTGKILNPGEDFIYDDLKFELIKKIRQKMVQFRVYGIQNRFEEIGNSGS